MLDFVLDIEGKTIKKCGYDWSDELILIFTDDTYTHFKAEEDYDGPAELKQGQIFNFYNDYGVKLGIITQEELDTRRKREEQENKVMREKFERKQYEILKAKYGD